MEWNEENYSRHESRDGSNKETQPERKLEMKNLEIQAKTSEASPLTESKRWKKDS